MNPKTILLVDDNPDDVQLALEALKINNILNHVAVANDGVEALDYLSSPAPPPAVILLDVKMPRMDGLEVLRQVRSNPNWKNLPVVMLTSSKENGDILRSYDLGCNSYICKAVDFDHFTAAIKQLGHYWLKLNETAPAMERPPP